MDIHQASVSYLFDADRLLLKVSTRAGELFQVWLTRRLMGRLWPHLTQHVTRVQAGVLDTRAVVTPEARAMAAQLARTQSLQQADFRTPFDASPKVQPLGAEPLLAVQAQLTLLPERQLRLVFADAARRELALQLPERLATALLALVEQALRQAEWDLPLAAPPAAGHEAPPAVLN